MLEICAAEEIPHRETDLTIEEVYRAEEVFCTGTMGELAGVTQVDFHAIGEGVIGPMTQHLGELYARRTASEGVPMLD